MWVVGCHIPARGWWFSGVRRVVFGWEDWMMVCGGCSSGGRVLRGAVVSSRRQRVANGGDARRRPLVAGERKRESEREAERERGGVGVRIRGAGEGSRSRDHTGDRCNQGRRTASRVAGLEPAAGRDELT